MVTETEIPQAVGWLFTPILGLVTVQLIAAWRACQAYPNFILANVRQALLPWSHRTRVGIFWASVFWLSAMGWASLIFLVFWMVAGDKLFEPPSAEQMNQIRVLHSALWSTVIPVVMT